MKAAASDVTPSVRSDEPIHRRRMPVNKSLPANPDQTSAIESTERFERPSR